MIGTDCRPLAACGRDASARQGQYRCRASLMSTGSIVPHRAGGGAYRGSRIPVRRRRLRGAWRWSAGIWSTRSRTLRGSHRSLGELRIPTPMRRCGAENRHARGRPPQRRRHRHRLSAGHPRRRAARSRLSEIGEADSGRDLAPEPAGPIRGSAETASRSSRSPTSAGSAAISNRWRLLPNVLGKQQAREAGAYEAWQVDARRPGHRRHLDQCLDRHGRRRGRDPRRPTTRSSTASPASPSSTSSRREGYRLVERPFTVAEAKAAREAFLTSTTADLLPVVRIDGEPVGDGRPGPAEPQIARRPIWRTPRSSACMTLSGSSRRQSRSKIRPPRAILFDWDNTLVDSWATIHEALNFLMRAMDKPLNGRSQDTKERVRLSLRESLPAAFRRALGGGAARSISTRFRAIHLERLTPLPGPRGDCCATWPGQGIYLGVVSNKTGELLRREVARLGWSALFRQRRRRRRRAARQAGLRPGAPGAGSRAASPPARRCGLSAIPRSTWNAPATAAASRCCSATRCRRRSLPGSLRASRRTCRSPTRRACFACCRGCDSTVTRPSS